MKHYQPKYKVTENYAHGMQAIVANQLTLAVQLLSAEPNESPCYGLALANKALAQLRLEDYEGSEDTGKLALAEFEAKGCPHPPTGVQTIRNLGEAISRQERLAESLPIFNNGCRMADKLANKAPDFADDLELEKGHTFNSWGGALLTLGDSGPAIEMLVAAREIYRKHPENKIGWLKH